MKIKILLVLLMLANLISLVAPVAARVSARVAGSYYISLEGGDRLDFVCDNPAPAVHMNPGENFYHYVVTCPPPAFTGK